MMYLNNSEHVSRQLQINQTKPLPLFLRRTHVN